MATHDKTQPDPTDDDTPSWERPRNGMGRFTRTLKSVRRDAAAADYAADNPDATLQQIADEFGYYDRGEARRGILRAKADVARPSIRKLIGTESDELDALYTEACAVLQRNHITVSHGKIVMWSNPDTGIEEPLLDDAPRLAAIRVALEIRRTYQELHGLKQPVKADVTVHEVTQQDLELQEMLREAQAAMHAEEQQIRGGTRD